MGKISILRPEQALVLNALAKEDSVTNAFYFTGGTALSHIYLQHRESIDLDFFSLQPVDQPQISALLTKLFAPHGISMDMQFVSPVMMCFLKFSPTYTLKVDFAQYPYPQIESSEKYIGKLRIDSLRDIAANKLQTITQRTEVKDYVDLYYVLKDFTFWDLRTAVAEKFHRDIEPFFLSSDFLAVDDFTYLPKMHTDLTLKELQRFFREQAIELSKTVVE